MPDNTIANIIGTSSRVYSRASVGASASVDDNEMTDEQLSAFNYFIAELNRIENAYKKFVRSPPNSRPRRHDATLAMIRATFVRP